MLGFLDRVISVTFRFHRENGRGVLHIQDASVPEWPQGKPRTTLARIPFLGTGRTELPSGEFPQDQLSLDVDAECITLAFRLIDLSLTHAPWAPETARPLT